MKLSASIDLTAKKAEATDLLNKWFDDQSKKLGSPVPQIHQAKLRIAQSVKGRAQPPASLLSEAAHRNMSIDALCDLIIQKDATMVSALIDLEARRQAALDTIANATSEQALKALQKDVLR